MLANGKTVCSLLQHPVNEWRSNMGDLDARVYAKMCFYAKFVFTRTFGVVLLIFLCDGVWSSGSGFRDVVLSKPDFWLELLLLEAPKLEAPRPANWPRDRDLRFKDISLRLDAFQSRHSETKKTWILLNKRWNWKLLEGWLWFTGRSWTPPVAKLALKFVCGTTKPSTTRNFKLQ